ncbi:MAG TPA: hypothetical protein VN711_00450 [Candidatus Saccharimonadales bacterium]|nr:hypothetical protein [Candidatus Saccharimonadales bacterium]
MGNRLEPGIWQARVAAIKEDDAQHPDDNDENRLQRLQSSHPNLFGTLSGLGTVRQWGAGTPDDARIRRNGPNHAQKPPRPRR